MQSTGSSRTHQDAPSQIYAETQEMQTGPVKSGVLAPALTLQLKAIEQFLKSIDKRAESMERVLKKNTEQIKHISDKLDTLETDLHALELRTTSHSTKIKDSIQAKLSSFTLIMRSIADHIDAAEKRALIRSDAAERQLAHTARDDADIAEQHRAADADRRAAVLERALSRRMTDLDESFRRAVRQLGSDLHTRLAAVARAAAVRPGRDGHSREAERAALRLRSDGDGAAGGRTGGRKDSLARLKPGMVLSHARTQFEERESAATRASWADYFFGICQPAEVITGPNDSVRKAGTCIVHPASRFNMGMTAASALLLVYCALLVPVQLSFWTSDDPCTLYPTIYFDAIADGFFLFEILVSFFVGYYDGQGNFVDSLPLIGKRYISIPTLFWLDAVTSIPVSFLELSLNQECGVGMNAADSEAYSRVRLTRVLKLIRPVKFVKLVRLVRAFQISSNLEDQLTLLGVTKNFFKLMRLFVFLFLTLHIFTCLYWRVKIDTATESATEFLATHGVPDDNIPKIYILCFYFIFTVVATVGFGDITAVNSSERIFCIILFLAGAITFGTIMAQLNEMLTDLNREQEALEQRMDSYAAVLKRYRIAAPLHIKIRRWIRFQFWEETADNKKKAVLADERLPEEFRVALATIVDSDLFAKIPFLQGIDENVRAKFAAELQLRSTTVYFTSQSLVASSKQPADRIMVVCSGVAELMLPPWSKSCSSQASPRGSLAKDQNYLSSEDKRLQFAENGVQDSSTLLRLITRGDVVGEGCIIGDRRWTGSYGVDADVVARVNCSFLCVSTQDIQAILRQFEYSVIRFRVQRAAWLFALHRAEICGDDEEGTLSFSPVENRKAIFSWMILFRHYKEAAERRRTAESGGAREMLRKLLACGVGGDVWGLSKEGPAAEVYQR